MQPQPLRDPCQMIGVGNRILLEGPIVCEPVQFGLGAEGFEALSAIGTVHTRVGQPASVTPTKTRESKWSARVS